MVADKAASALESLREVRSCTSSAGGVGVGVGVPARCFDLRKRDIAKMDGQIGSIIGFGLEAGWQRDL